MKNKRIGLITLSITLISLGIILLINNFLPIDIDITLQILVAISIILIGVELLFFNWYYNKKKIVQNIKISGSSIILLMIIYSICFIFTSISININKEESVDIIKRLLNYANEYQYTKSYTEDANDLEKIVIDNDGGNIEINATDRDDIKIDSVIYVSTYQTIDDIKVFADDIITFNRNKEKTLRIGTKNERNNYSQVYVDYTIEIPKNLQVSIKNENGNVYVYDLNKKTEIVSCYSNILVKNINDEVYIENKYGNVEVNTVNGNTEISNEDGDVNVKKIGGNLDINNRYGNIEFEDILGNVNIEQKQAQIIGNSVDKNLDIDAYDSSIEIKNIVGKVHIENNNEKIIAKKINNDIEINNECADIVLEEINGNILLYCENGNIDINNHAISVKEMKIENKYGKVEIDIPNEQQGKFSMHTKNGVINSIIYLDINKDENEELVDSTIGDVDNLISIYNTNGDIVLE